QDEEHRLIVVDAKERYTRMYLDLAHENLSTRFLGGGFTVDGFSSVFGALVEKCHIRVTSDSSPIAATDDRISMEGAPELQLSSSRARDLEAPFLVAALGEIAIGEVDVAQRSIVRFGLALPDGTAAQVESLGGTLNIDGFDILQCVVVTRGINGNSPKTYYAT
ncbi:hypothetical protein, partial [Frankia sp. EI5c]|uniref:hypothetical protein n=1 Tax=Frankia sp. EI5c TaxID=683316 RepID=UPI001A7E4F1A